MSYVLAEFSDGSYEYYENVSVSWGDLGITLDVSKREYFYINPAYLVRLSVADTPFYDVQLAIEEEDDTDEDEPVSTTS